MSALTLVLTLLLRNRNAVRLLREAKEEVVFLIVDQKDDFDSMALAEEVARHPEESVLIVSPFLLSRRGVGEESRMFVCYRKESENVYILRNYFFFYFRRRLLKKGIYKIEEIHRESQK